MAKKHHVIYIAGLSDKQAYGQVVILKLWWIFGIKAHYHKIGWTEDVPFQVKLQEVLSKIDSLAKDGSDVSLVGSSAAGCTAILAYSKRKDKVSGVVTICAKLLNPEPINPEYFRLNPPLKESLFSAQPIIRALTKKEKAKILCLYPFRDKTVRIIDMVVPGSSKKRILAFSHVPAIYTAIIFYSPLIAKFIKS